MVLSVLSIESQAPKFSAQFRMVTISLNLLLANNLSIADHTLIPVRTSLVYGLTITKSSPGNSLSGAGDVVRWRCHFQDQA